MFYLGGEVEKLALRPVQVIVEGNCLEDFADSSLKVRVLDEVVRKLLKISVGEEDDAEW